MPDPETQEVILAMPPMYHIYGITLIICLGFFRSAKLVILPRFKEATYLQTIEKYKVNQIRHLLDLSKSFPAFARFGLLSTVNRPVGS